MPTSSDKTEPKVEPKAAAKKVNPRDLVDEMEVLKAQGNPDPDRLAELKTLIAKG